MYCKLHPKTKIRNIMVGMECDNCYKVCSFCGKEKSFCPKCEKEKLKKRDELNEKRHKREEQNFFSLADPNGISLKEYLKKR